jgi:hypothetical protein
MTLPGFTAKTSIYKTRVHYHAVCSLAETAGVAVKPGIVPPFRKPNLKCDACYWDLYDTGECVRDCYVPPCQPGDPLCGVKLECPPSACGCRPVGIDCQPPVTAAPAGVTITACAIEGPACLCQPAVRAIPIAAAAGATRMGIAIASALVRSAGLAQTRAARASAAQTAPVCKRSDTTWRCLISPQRPLCIRQENPLALGVTAQSARLMKQSSRSSSSWARFSYHGRFVTSFQASAIVCPAVGSVSRAPPPRRHMMESSNASSEIAAMRSSFVSLAKCLLCRRARRRAGVLQRC